MIWASADWTLHLRGLEIRPWQQVLLGQRLRTLELLLRVVAGDLQPLQIRLGARDVCSLLFDLRVQDRRVEPRDDLALLHEVVEVGVEVLDDAADLRAHLHGRDGFERARCLDGLDHVAAGNLRRPHLGFLGVLAHVIPAAGAADDREQDDDRYELFHVCVWSLRVLGQPRAQSFPAFFENRVHRGHEDERDER